MAAGTYDPRSAGRAEPARPRRSPADALHCTTAAARRLLVWGRAAVGRRTPRPHLAYLGVPLAIIASMLADPILAPALIVCGWWWAPRDWGWEWLVVAGRGLMGIEWALIGVNLLAAYPGARLASGIVWANLAVFIGWLGYWSKIARTQRSDRSP